MLSCNHRQAHQQPRKGSLSAQDDILSVLIDANLVVMESSGVGRVMAMLQVLGPAHETRPQAISRLTADLGWPSPQRAAEGS